MRGKLSWMIGACLLALCACDSGEEEVEPRGTAIAHEACTRDNDCIIALFCHPTEFECVISLDPCVGIDLIGICDGQIATWCENESLKGIDCAANGKECGFSNEKGLFDCLEPEEN